MRNLSIAICVLLGLSGCEQYVPVETPPIGHVERKYVLAYVLDTSGSFVMRMFDGNGIGYRFFLKGTDLYFRNRMGDHDRILISQLSADDRTLLWEGPPLALRRRFGSSDALRTFIEEKSNPYGSRVYAAMADTLDYIYQLPGVSEGETEVCVLVLSDMLDNSPTQEEDRQRLSEALSRFAESGGSIGFYWVDQFCLSECRQYLADSGVENYVVESDIVDDPALPFSQL